MKILFVHNFYGSSAPSGENRVYEAERELLRGRGHEVMEVTRDSDGIRAQGGRGMMKGALSAPWNPFVCAEVRSGTHFGAGGRKRLNLRSRRCVGFGGSDDPTGVDAPKCTPQHGRRFLPDHRRMVPGAFCRGS